MSWKDKGLFVSLTNEEMAEYEASPEFLEYKEKVKQMWEKVRLDLENIPKVYKPKVYKKRHRHNHKGR